METEVVSFFSCILSQLHMRCSEIVCLDPALLRYSGLRRCVLTVQVDARQKEVESERHLEAICRREMVSGRIQAAHFIQQGGYPNQLRRVARADSAILPCARMQQSLLSGGDAGVTFRSLGCRQNVMFQGFSHAILNHRGCAWLEGYKATDRPFRALFFFRYFHALAASTCGSSRGD